MEVIASRYEITSPESLWGSVTGPVFRATDRETGTPVFLKVQELSDLGLKPLRLWVERENSVLVNVSHPALLQPLDVGLDGGRAYIVFRAVEGSILATWLQRGPLPQPLALKVGRALLEGIAALHEHDVVHRNLHPGLILVTESGDPPAVILDVGLAKPLGGAQAEVMEGDPSRFRITMGEPPFRAPEQHLDDPVDHRADLYAIGMILYFCFGGESPWGAGKVSTEIVLDQLRQPPRAIQAVAPYISPEIDAFLMKLIARRPSDRFSTAAEALAAFPELDTGRPG